MKFVPAVGVLIFKDDTVLLVKHGEKAEHINGVYGVPSEKLNKGETEKEAVVRELYEETGLTTEEKNLVDYPNNSYTAIVDRKGGIQIKSTVKIFLCSEYKGELRGTDEAVPEWVEISKMNSFNLLPNIERAVRDAKNSKKI